MSDRRGETCGRRLYDHDLKPLWYEPQFVGAPPARRYLTGVVCARCGEAPKVSILTPEGLERLRREMESVGS